MDHFVIALDVVKVVTFKMVSAHNQMNVFVVQDGLEIIVIIVKFIQNVLDIAQNHGNVIVMIIIPVNIV